MVEVVVTNGQMNSFIIDQIEKYVKYDVADNFKFEHIVAPKEQPERVKRQGTTLSFAELGPCFPAEYTTAEAALPHLPGVVRDALPTDPKPLNITARGAFSSACGGFLLLAYNAIHPTHPGDIHGRVDALAERLAKLASKRGFDCLVGSSVRPRATRPPPRFFCAQRAPAQLPFPCSF